MVSSHSKWENKYKEDTLKYSASQKQLTKTTGSKSGSFVFTHNTNQIVSWYLKSPVNQYVPVSKC